MVLSVFVALPEQREGGGQGQLVDVEAVEGQVQKPLHNSGKPFAKARLDVG